MAEEVAALNFRLEATLARYERALSRAEGRMGRAARTIQRQADGLDKRLEQFGRRFGVNLNPRVLAASGAIAALGKAIADVVRNGDRIRQLEGRFQALTGSAERAGDLIRAAFEIGGGTGIGFDAAADTLTRFRIAADAVGATDDEVIQLTDNVAKLGIIGGSSAQEVANGARQLGQALASGRLQGDELRSVLENLPLVARQIADGLGVGVGQLRQMAKDGELTAERVFGALLKGTDEITRKFNEMPQTVERAADQLATAWTRFTAELDNSLGVSDALITSLTALSLALDDLSGAAQQQSFGASIRNSTIAQLRRAREREIELSLRDEMEGRPSGSITAGNIAQIDRRIAEIIAEQQSRQGRLSGARRPAGSSAGTGAPGTSPEPPRAPFELGVPDPATGGGRARADGAAQILDQMRQRIELLGQEQQLAGQNALQQAVLTAEFERQRIVREFMARAAEDGIPATEEQIAQAGELAQRVKDESIALAILNDALATEAERQREATAAGERHAQVIRDVSSAITQAILNADSFSDALRNVAVSLANIVIQRGADSISSSLATVLGSVVGGLFGGGATAPVSGQGFGVAPGAVDTTGFFFARGAAFQQGRVIPFARGGVVDAPTLFPMADGLGLMGEAGPEAVLPLRRGRGGKLGVAASGGGGGVEVNVFAPPGSQVTEQRQKSGDLEQINILIDQAVGRSLTTPGRAGNRALQANFGARQQLVRR